MKLARTVFVAAAALVAAGAAQAAPIGPAPIDGGGAPVIQVRGGCGFGAHRGPYGGCRVNNGPRGAVRRMMGPPPRGCPPGMFRGRCRPY